MVAISNYYVGVNIGSVSVNLVSVDEKGKHTIAKEGRTLLIACHDRELLGLGGVVRLHMRDGQLEA